MSRPLAAIVLALALVTGLAQLPGCGGPPAAPEPRIVAVAPPPEVAPPRRFELTEAATVASSTDPRRVELWVPLASSEPDVQAVESLLIRVSPITSYEVTADPRGNHVLHVRYEGTEALAVAVTYQVERRPWRLDPGRAEKRELSPGERATLGAELGGRATPGAGPGEAQAFGAAVRGSVLDISSPRIAGGSEEEMLAAARRAGWPARVGTGVRVSPGGPIRATWLELYVPGVGWAPRSLAAGDPDPALLGDQLVIVARGEAPAVARALVGGRESELLVEYSARDLAER